MTKGGISVVHLATGLGVGGAETILFRVLSEMRKSPEVAHRVISLRDNCAFDFESIGVQVEVFDLAESTRLPSHLMALRRRLDSLAPDLIHGWMYHGSVAAALLAPKRIPLIWGIHHSLHDFSAESLSIRSLVRAGAILSRLSRTKALLYCSNVSMDHHREFGYPQSKAVILPNGFDGAEFAPQPNLRENVRAALGIEASSVVVGSFGRYHPVKDHSLLLQAFARSSARHKCARLLLAGAGLSPDNRELCSTISRLGIEDRVTLVGQRSDMAGLYNAIDIYALSSKSESFPNVLGEASCCGTVCVTTDVGDSKLILGPSGIVVPPGSVGEFSLALDHLISISRNERIELGRAARQHVLDHFSIESIAGAYRRIYSKYATRPKYA